MSCGSLWTVNGCATRVYLYILEVTPVKLVMKLLDYSFGMCHQLFGHDQCLIIILKTYCWVLMVSVSISQVRRQTWLRQFWGWIMFTESTWVVDFTTQFSMSIISIRPVGFSFRIDGRSSSAYANKHLRVRYVDCTQFEVFDCQHCGYWTICTVFNWWADSYLMNNNLTILCLLRLKKQDWCILSNWSRFVLVFLWVYDSGC